MADSGLNVIVTQYRWCWLSFSTQTRPSTGLVFKFLSVWLWPNAGILAAGLGPVYLGRFCGVFHSSRVISSGLPDLGDYQAKPFWLPGMCPFKRKALIGRFLLTSDKPKYERVFVYIYIYIYIYIYWISRGFVILNYILVSSFLSTVLHVDTV